jgi:hypothetical protein
VRSGDVLKANFVECPKLDIITLQNTTGECDCFVKKEPILGAGRHRSGLQSYTDLNSLCYNSFSGHGHMLRVVGLASGTGGTYFLTVSCRYNPGIRLYGVETVDTGDSIDSKKRQENQGFPSSPVKTKWGRSSVG